MTLQSPAYRSEDLIHDLLDAAAEDRPEAVAIRDAEGAWSYRETVAASRAVAAWLCAVGVRRGDRLVVQLPTDRRLVALMFGVSRCGAVFVPLNPAMKRFHLESVLDNAEPRLAITSGERVDVFRAATGIPVHDLDQLWPRLAEQETGTEVATVGEPDDVAVLVYTSGSTAAPKAVICPHRQMVFAVGALDTELGYRSDDVVFCRFPMSWDYGLYKVLMACYARAEIVLAGEESDLRLVRRMRETGATIVPIVPSLAAMIAGIAGRESEPPPPVRMFTNTGAALPKTTIDALREHFPGTRIVRQFGQTECKRISVMPPGLEEVKPESVGRPLPGTQVSILDPDGRPVPLGEVGEIVVTGPHVMPGYWRAPRASARSFRVDPETGRVRLHTGDYGSLDTDGYLYFDGRRDDMFKRKGIRMSTLEIESAAMDIPQVRTAAVVPPGPDRDLAIVVESGIGEHVVLKELAQRLESAKVPAICRVVEELPLTMHGKNSREGLLALLDGGGQ